MIHRKQGDEDGYDFRAIKARFLRLNQDRLTRLRDDLRPSQQDFLHLLPLLFHVNHPLLPGYVGNDTPAGIPDYSPDKTALAAGRRLAKSFELKKKAYRKFDIHAVYLMGSTGTIAYTDKSDFDIWICHAPELDAGQLETLRSKAVAIEQWARSLDLDANIFLVNPERFKAGQQGPISSESSGSALHYLLLEEFYRTSVLLAGRYPVWWLVPPEKEADYDSFVAEIKLKRYVHSKDHIDLGGLCDIKAEEFYGASLWMLYKGINSPYKSILKIILMEAYASEFPDIDLLCVRYKRQVYEEEILTSSKVDPYLMMLHKVEEYLQRQNQPERLELVRRSFYFKVNEKISQPPVSKSNWRHDSLSELVEAWGWHHGQLLRLDMRDEWKLNSVIEERKALINEFTTTYRFLSEFTRLHGSESSVIKPEDVHILGRKLYAAFERKAGKIEIIYRGITSGLLESHLSFHRLESDEGDEYWMVFSGIIPRVNIHLASPLRRAYSLMELVAWCYFNRIIDKHTVLAVYSDDSDLTEKELALVVDNMCRLFPEEVLQESSMYDLRQPARINAIGTFINVGVDPFASHTRQGRHLTSSRTDALKYGGRLENLALSIDQVIVTSWQEVLTFRYMGIKGLMKCLQDYINWSPPSCGRRPPPINAFSFSSYRGSSIARRIENLFADILRCFYDAAAMESTHYIIGIEWEYYVLQIEKDTFKYQRLGEMEALLAYLAAPQPRFARIVFDRETLSEHVLPVIYAHNRAGVIQCFYEVKGQTVTVYILDEKGTLTTQVMPFQDVLGLVKHYQEFFGAIHDRMLFLGQDELTRNSSINEVEFYRIDPGLQGSKSIRQHSVNEYFKPSGYLRLQVIVSALDGKPVFTVFCEDQEFSTLESGSQLYKKVAECIVALRARHERYPIYITDIDLAPTLIGDTVAHLQTAHYLEYKKMIEQRLLDELQ